MSSSRIATKSYIRNNGLLLPITIGMNEKEILDTLEYIYNTKILRCYKVNRFFLDGYSKDLNIAFEVDEKHHLKKIEGDRQRQREIERELGCEFIRIKDY